MDCYDLHDVAERSYKLWSVTRSSSLDQARKKEPVFLTNSAMTQPKGGLASASIS